MFIVSVLAEISKTLTNSPRPPVVPSVVPDFHLGIPPGHECTPHLLHEQQGLGARRTGDRCRGVGAGASTVTQAPPLCSISRLF
jgi:hypothetical protein